MNRSPLHLVLVLSLSACGEEEPSFVSVASLDHDLVFAFSLDENDRPIDVEGPIVLDDARAGMRFARIDAAESVLLLAFSDDEVSALTPLYQPAEYARFSLGSLGLDDCRETGRLSSKGDVLQLPVPEAWSRYRTADDGVLAPAQFDLTGWDISVPVDPDACTGPGHDELVPFAETARPILAGEMIGTEVVNAQGLIHNDVLRVDETRVLTASGPWILLFERGEPFVNDAMHAWRLPRMANARALAMDRDPSRAAEPGKLRIVAAVAVSLVSDSTSGQLVELVLGDEGIEHIRTSSVSTRIDDVLVDPKTGRVVAASRNALVYTQAAPGAPVEEVMIPDLGDEDGALAYTGDAQYPYLLGGTSEGSVFLGSADAKEWVVAQAGLPIANYPAVAGFSTADGLELWASQFTGLVLRQAPGASEFQTQPVVLPPSFRGCGLVGACGWAVQPNSAARFAALGDTSLLLTTKTCAAIVELRRDGACSDYLAFADRPVETLSTEEGSDEGFREVSVTDDFVTVVSRSGDIYEWRRTR